MILNVGNSTSLREWHFTARCSIFRIPAVTTAFRQLVLIPVPAGCTIILETGGLGKQSSRILSVEESQLTAHQETEIRAHRLQKSELLQDNSGPF